MTDEWWTGTKEARFENIEIPERFGPFEITFDERRLKHYTFAQDDHRPWYFSAEESPFGVTVAPPMALANDLLFLFYAHYDGNTAQGLHTREELTFGSPVHIGEHVTISGAYVDTYQRRGNGYVVMEAEARGEDGRLLLHHRGTEIMRVHAADVVGKRTAAPPERVVTGEYRTDVAPATSAAADLVERTPLPTVTKHISQEQMYVFSWGGRGFSNIHTDPVAARRSGLDRTVAQAMQQVGYLSEMLTDFFGPTWITSGRLRTKFIRPFYVEDTVAARGAVLGPIACDGEKRLEIEVWVENAAGEMTAVGWADAPFPAS